MSIVLQGSTSGSITLQEPAIAGSTVLDLPAVSGTILTTTSPKAGNVIQVVQTVKTNSFSTSSTSWVDWTDMSVTITPSSSSSKFFITLTSGVSNTSDTSFQYVKLQRNGTDIARGDVLNSATRCWIDGAHSGAGVSTQQKPLVGSFLDSPNTTSAVTYKLQVIRTLNGTAYFGSSTDGADANRSSIPSVLTVMEIAG